MKTIAVFTGAGISAESGVSTFRDIKNGLWYNYDVDEVATIEGWNKDPNKVNEFHNMLRAKLNDIKPNAAHKALVDLEEFFDVTIITQNIDSLHELAGSSKVLHLHGELYKSRGVSDPNIMYECHGDILENDKCEKGSRLRPHTVLFGEMPYNVDEAYGAIHKCDYLLIIGTSLNISYTIPMLKSVKSTAKIIYIDPEPSMDLEHFYVPIEYVRKKAIEGVTSVVDNIIKEYNKGI